MKITALTEIRFFKSSEYQRDLLLSKRFGRGLTDTEKFVTREITLNLSGAGGNTITIAAPKFILMTSSIPVDVLIQQSATTLTIAQQELFFITGSTTNITFTNTSTTLKADLKIYIIE
jgi:hypothetical protein